MVNFMVKEHTLGLMETSMWVNLRVGDQMVKEPLLHLWRQVWRGFKDGERTGQGTFKWSDGDKYVGEFKDGKRNGQGTYTWSGGSKYVGEWKDDKKDGQGTYIYGKGKLKGDKYVGEFRDGYRNGQGTYTWSDEGKYEGKWKNGKFHGQGTYTFSDGNKGVGEFRYNKPWNITHRDKNGNIIVKFVNGKQIKP